MQARRANAENVPRWGRALLDVVLEALRRGGALLVEADTDGVFFSAPEGSGEDAEGHVRAK